MLHPQYTSNALKKVFRLIGFKFSRHTLHLPPFYQEYSPSLSLDLLDTRGLISHKYRFAYFRIPKAANSTVVASLYHAETSHALTSLTEIQEIKDSYYYHPSSLSTEQVMQFQRSYFKFTFVRNPYTRVLAAYLDKIVSNHTDKRDAVAKFLDKSVDSKISFDDFLDYLENGGINRNAHWARQCDLLPVPLSELDFVGKIENLANDLEHVLKSIFEVSKPIISVREHATRASYINEKISLSAKNRVDKLYASDFDKFGYS